MSLTSPLFFIAFGISLMVYYIVPKRFQWPLLLIFSVLFFLASSDPKTIVFLLISIITTALCAQFIEKARKSTSSANLKSVTSDTTGKNTAKAVSPGSAALSAGILINLLILAILKYHHFFIDNLNALLRLFGQERHIAGFSAEPAAPIGISFYTMIVIAYLVDVYWGVTKAENGLFKNALFISYWPLLTSGPIVRHKEMQDELFSRHSFDAEEIASGLQRMLWGIFKKLVISARLGILVDTIYSDINQYQGIYLILAMGMFLLQLYTDFSGCMDIIIGASECYGIRLPENFDHPFHARSIQEYWQRWHITLGLWLRDYIMYPRLRSKGMRDLNSALKKRVGRKTANQITTYLGMLMVWLLIGLWHGGDWKFIIGMGLWFYACIVLGEVLKPTFNRLIGLLRINSETDGWHFFQSCRVFVLAAIGNVFFRLPSLSDALLVICRAFTVWNPWILFDGSLHQLGLNEKNCHLLIVCLALGVFVSQIQRKESFRSVVRRQNLVFRWTIWIALILSIVIFGMYGPGYQQAAFIYQQF